uniref:Uncharacterized protein n=1 Tax=Caudovirales sp. ctikv1 TaxID=2826781 RepID=A0A8S5N2L8_9CAUD|nr:MAG TPA: hypothetical protein [Caudovirales sp. ctikv1]
MLNSISFTVSILLFIYTPPPIIYLYYIILQIKIAYQPRYYPKLIGYLLCYSVINSFFTTDN